MFYDNTVCTGKRVWCFFVNGNVLVVIGRSTLYVGIIVIV